MQVKSYNNYISPEEKKRQTRASDLTEHPSWTTFLIFKQVNVPSSWKRYN